MIRSPIQQSISELAVKVSHGDQDAFKELERVAQPLLRSLASRFSGYHHRFEYDDFYIIGMTALYTACTSYNPLNPSFLDYAKVIILREYWRELDYQNAQKRTAFANDLSYDQIINDIGDTLAINDLVEKATMREMHRHIEIIIDTVFSEDKAVIMKKYLFDEMRIADIARETGLKYKNVHSTVRRGIDRIRQEYSSRFLDEEMVV